jgi:hypothetical protein
VICVLAKLSAIVRILVAFGDHHHGGGSSFDTA